MTTAAGETLISVPPCNPGSGTIRLVDEVICARILDGVHFDHDFTFVRPEAKPIIREIVDDINRDQERLVLLVGHTDRSGSNAYNETLSQSRALSVFGYITNQPAIWMELLRTMLNNSGGPRVARSGSGQSADRWQVRELQYMLSYLRSPSTGERYYGGLIDNLLGGGTQAALDAFRADNGIPAGGGAGPRWAGVDEETWEALFTAYIGVDAVQVDPARFLDPQTLGCGEGFPRIETRAPGTENQDLRDADARLETNRRVEFLLIPPSLVPDPLTCERIYEGPITVCPQSPQPISVTLVFTDAQTNRPLRDASGNVVRLPVRITGTGGFTFERETDENGRVQMPDGDTVQGDYRVSVVGSFGLALRPGSPGEVRGAEVLLHLTRSTVVEIAVTPVPARLNFVANTPPFGSSDELTLLDTLPNPIGALSPVEFRIVADIDGLAADVQTVTVDLLSFLLRGPTSPVPGDPGGGSGIVLPATQLEFVDGANLPIEEIDLNRRFRLRLDTGDIAADEVVVLVSSRFFK
ncbi:MAG TPA: OmpA family protein [Roseiflexaceae bacterium]|nr:OmpA family protein [Roseiflexaceae bacterium]